MGTPDFSLEPLKELVKAGHNVSLVLTREDKKRNRGELTPTPVKELANSLNKEIKSRKCRFFCSGGIWKDFAEGDS